LARAIAISLHHGPRGREGSGSLSPCAGRSPLGPTGPQDIASGVHVSVIAMRTRRALEHRLASPARSVDMPAERASLRGEPGRDDHQLATSVTLKPTHYPLMRSHQLRRSKRGGVEGHPRSCTCATLGTPAQAGVGHLVRRRPRHDGVHAILDRMSAVPFNQYRRRNARHRAVTRGSNEMHP
jgi:hypothetical protein